MININPTGTGIVALYSGGVDSYCMAALDRPDVLLHINIGGAYGSEETHHMNTPHGLEDRLVTVDLPELAMFELTQSHHVLPARNAIFTLIGAQYGHRVLLAGIEGGRGSDKDQGYADRMTELLRWIWQPQDMWNPRGRDTVVELPYRHLTKRQLVHLAVKQGAVTGEELRDRTFSCYTPIGGSPCGNCAPCARKWAALAAEGIDPGYSAREAFRPYWEEVKSGNLNPARNDQWVTDTMDAWNSPY